MLVLVVHSISIQSQNSSITLDPQLQLPVSRLSLCDLLLLPFGIYSSGVLPSVCFSQFHWIRRTFFCYFIKYTDYADISFMQIKPSIFGRIKCYITESTDVLFVSYGPSPFQSNWNYLVSMKFKFASLKEVWQRWADGMQHFSLLSCLFNLVAPLVRL